MTEKITEFQGLHKEGMVFLEALSMQNDPIFFNANKEIYLDHIKKQLVELNAALEPCINRIDMDLDTRAKRTICRIRKDARYAKENPYRTNMWMSFKPADKSNSNYFTYFFYYDTSYYEIGVGFYGTQKTLMDEFRGRIDANPSLFTKVIDSIDFDNYELEGEDYKRPLQKISLSNAISKWYNKKGFYVYKKKKINETVFTKDLVNEIEEAFFDLMPLYDFVVGKKIRFDKQNI